MPGMTCPRHYFCQMAFSQRQVGNERLAAHVLAAAEQKRRLGGVGVALEVADEDDVVAAIMPILVAALEMRSGADQDRGAAFRDHMVDLGEFVLVRSGKFVRQLDLVVGQYIDDEMRALLERRQALRAERGAPQDQRRGSDIEVKELA